MSETRTNPETSGQNEPVNIIESLRITEDEIDDKDGKLDKKEIERNYYERLLPALRNALNPFDKLKIEIDVNQDGVAEVKAPDEILKQTYGDFLRHTISSIKEKELEDATTMTEIRQEKNLDPLTGLLNKNGLKDAFKRKTEGLNEYKKNLEETGGKMPDKGLGFIFVDIDFFKSLNDKYGQEGGDEILRQFAKRIELAVRRRVDIVSRDGGEEFIVIIHNIEKKDLEYVANKIHERTEGTAENPYEYKDEKGLHKIELTTSLGVDFVSLDNLEDSPDEILKSGKQKANEAEMWSKLNGRNQITYYDKMKKERENKGGRSHSTFKEFVAQREKESGEPRHLKEAEADANKEDKRQPIKKERLRQEKNLSIEKHLIYYARYLEAFVKQKEKMVEEQEEQLSNLSKDEREQILDRLDKEMDQINGLLSALDGIVEINKQIEEKIPQNEEWERLKNTKQKFIDTLFTTK